MGVGSGLRCHAVALLVPMLGACSRAAVSSPAAADAGATAAVQPAGFLRWDLRRTEDARIVREAVSWIDGRGVARWSTPLPPRFRRSVCCWNALADEYVRDPAHGRLGRAWPWSMVDDAVAVEDEGVLLVLGLADGHVRFEWTDDRSPQAVGDPQYGAVIDRGAVDIDVGSTTCTSDMLGQTLLRACGRDLVYFQRGLLAVFDTRPYRLVASASVRGPGLALDAPRDASRASGEIETPVNQTATVGGVTVTFRGVRVTSWQR